MLKRPSLRLAFLLPGKERVLEERLAYFPIDPSEPGHLERLIRKVHHVQCGHEAPTARHTPLRNTLEYVRRLGARSCILQRDVYDPDFFAEHAAYYSKWSLVVPRFCQRFHFFSSTAKAVDTLEVLDELARDKGTYLGFITLRPVAMSPIGATILAPEGPRDRQFILAKDEFPVNLAGHRFTVTGTPFMQQDNAVGACAQASIWMALRTQRRKEGRAAHSPAQITLAASRFLVVGRTLPNRGGLVIEQITEAVRAAGYSPHTIPLKDSLWDEATEESLRKAKQALYPYVESGIPVLTILSSRGPDSHAVVTVGHGWTQDPTSVVEILGNTAGSATGVPRLIDSATWAAPFIIHNDNTGPYRQLPNYPSQGHSYSLSQAYMAIPFLPQDVFIDGNEARSASIRLLLNSLRGLRRLLSGDADGEGDPLEVQIPDIVARVYIQDKAEFRSWVLNSGMSAELKRYYRMKWLPRRIWIMEINALDGYEVSPDEGRVRLGEIVLDPTAEPEDGAFLTVHLGAELLPAPSAGDGVVIDRDGQTGKIDAFRLPSLRYSPLVR
jgi:hypothetical protein